ncbi:hypothetical protein M011DRAFT_405203 [Sporormia fimetaria CBS 119925]|uniref:DUF4048 domain-containing protein n=1 Tax=Sporormia fimetaria CBS 119925 TaxID=1340428 RepID=A0A6A6V8L1_9PLEO|nr:hypothetical protein M011DRAFT_405203 [Sporormia fimetaria CBS 119925]
MSSHSRIRTRTMSNTDVVRQGKRLSLQFPIQPAAGSNSPLNSPRSRPQSWVATPSPSTPDVVPSPTENNFLAILAAQERYVLELREELAKAEEDLKRVKKQWATHQAVKQRNELRKITQLQPLNTGLPNVPPDQEDEDGSALWMQREMERRKALLSGTKTSQRKVFSGSRHLRTLSLLSPDRNYAPSFPQPADTRNTDEPVKQQPPLPRPTTSPDAVSQAADASKDPQYETAGLTNIQRDALLRTGKQMANDFKDGLLTFIEDIRQATVGEDSAATVDPSAPRDTRKPTPVRPGLTRASSSKKSALSQSTGVADDFWREHGLEESKSAPTQKKSHALKHARTPQKPVAKDDDFEEWDNWDTPADKPSTAQDSDDSDASAPASGQASSRTSTSSAGGLLEGATPHDAKRNSIPWPDLVKLSPGNLKRTASHLMKEWEKNLTPPPEARESSHMSGDYIGRSASPAGGA